MRVLRARLDWKAGWPLIWVGVVVAVGFGVLAATLLAGSRRLSWPFRSRSAMGSICVFVTLFGLACVARGIRCLRSRPPPPPPPP